MSSTADGEKTAAWRALVAAARAYVSVEAPTGVDSTLLSEATKAWAKASETRTRDTLVPFGRAKGQPLSACTDRDPDWLEQRAVNSGGAP